MLNYLQGLLLKLFSQQPDVETFIISKNPQNAADIEYWSRVYFQKNGGNL